MHRIVALLCISGLLACGDPAPKAKHPAAVAPTDAAVDDPRANERIAAIQWAMNQLDRAAQQCWAAAAVIDYKVAGHITASIDFHGATPAVTFTKNEPNNQTLTACMTRIIEGVRWPPVMQGEVVELPFAFTAPHGQYVIDRALVPFVPTASGATIAVLIDKQNTGTSAASVIEERVAKGARGEDGAASADELWVFLSDAEISDRDPTKTTVRTGDAMVVRKGAERAIFANYGAADAVVVHIPGGVENAIRAGGSLSLPATRAAGIPLPRIVHVADAARIERDSGAATILIESKDKKSNDPSVTLREFVVGIAEPTEQHDRETELLIVLAGTGTITINDVSQAIGPTSIVQIPVGAPHALTATETIRAVQVFTPGGPEQRYKK